ncbi:MAG TPA: asparagine synthase (glutamine-hydrolyzing) [Pyrinomonadaceae bacterium]|nr:asparagine synthase (glutamine-hydrolyzing) [Pyrinomonadaceae bacterium]
MCGIFGIHRNHGESLDVAKVLRSTTALRHRGPDDEGYLLVNTRSCRTVACRGKDTVAELDYPSVESVSADNFDLAFGFRRLSILDTSPAGHQPMASRDGKYWLILNGEVYNYVELREELSGLGHEFHTRTDTEVVLAAYREWGKDCLARFVGMWALALYDADKRQLFLARDPFGIKPLYYTSNDRGFVFASEIKALVASGEVGLDVNPQRLYDYLASGLTDHTDETLFAKIRQLPAAHSMTVPLDSSGQPQRERYWEIDLDRKLDLAFDDAAGQLRNLFLDNVRLHLRSDVRVGAALSGGIDSSSIVMGMRRADPDLALHTISYAADDPAVSEEKWADIVGTAAHAEVYKTRPTPSEMVADLDRLIESQDEPFGSTSIYAQYRVFQRAHEAGIIVMLDGQGADEMLAGYPGYLVPRLASLLRQGRLLRANKLAGHAAGLPAGSRKNLLVGAGGMLLPSAIRQGNVVSSGLRNLARRTGLLNGSSTLTALNNEWFASRGAVPWRYANGHTRDRLQKTLHNTLVQTSLPMLLRYEDRNSMAHSIESRVPFLTTAMAEFILALPEEYLIAPDATSKSIFRRAMRGIVPDAILDRKDKVGFATPERNWLATLRPWVDNVFQSEAAAHMPALNLPAMKQEWEQIRAGHKAFDFRVWRWLNTIQWVQNFQVRF